MVRISTKKKSSEPGTVAGELTYGPAMCTSWHAITGNQLRAVYISFVSPYCAREALCSRFHRDVFLIF